MKNTYIFVIVVLAVVLSLIGYVTYQDRIVVEDTLVEKEPVAEATNASTIPIEQTFMTQEIDKFNSYPQFQLKYPQSWTYSLATENDSQPKHYFQKSEKRLVIDQVQGGGEECVTSSNQIDPNNPEFFIDLSNFEVERLSTTIGEFLYYEKDNKINFCGPVAENPGKYFQISLLGSVYFEYGSDLEDKDLEEVNAILKSIELAQ